MPPDPEQERLEELQDEIDDVRRGAEEHGTIPPSGPPRTFADPDGDGKVDPTPVTPPG
jgi:hypothetical protein